jgi:hypothetical protein
VVVLFDFSAAVVLVDCICCIGHSSKYVLFVFIRACDRCQTVSNTHRRHLCRALKALIRQPAILSRVIDCTCNSTGETARCIGRKMICLRATSSGISVFEFSAAVWSRHSVHWP